jgi:hypothetical protein
MLLAPNIYNFFASAKPTLRALRAFEAIRAFNAMTESYCAVEAVGFLSRAGSSLSLSFALCRSNGLNEATGWPIAYKTETADLGIGFYNRLNGPLMREQRQQAR